MAPTNTRTRARAIPLPNSVPSEPVVNGDNGSPFTTGQPEPPSLDDVKPEMGKSKADTNLIIEALKQAYVLLGTVTVPFNQADGFTIVRNAEDMAESWRMLLDNDAKMRRRMKSLIQGSGWGTVVTAHIPVVIAIMANHRDSFQHLVRRRDTDRAAQHQGASAS